MPAFDDVQVLAFDVFGTVVDWRGSIARELDALRQRALVDDEHLARARPRGLDKGLRVDGAGRARGHLRAAARAARRLDGEVLDDVVAGVAEGGRVGRN